LTPERVLFAYRSDIDVHGGAATVMHETAAALRALGVTVDVTFETLPDATGYDLVHAFNIWKPDTALEQLRHLRESGARVVWLPFYLHWTETAWAIRAVRHVFERGRGDAERVELLRQLTAGTLEHDGFRRYWPNEIEPGFHGDLAEMLGCVDHVCAISHREVQTLFQVAGIESRPFTVTRHGVDASFGGVSPEPFRELVGDGEFVLCVGALDARKNQLLLVEALRGTGLKLVLLGPCFEPDYRQLCLDRGGDAVVHLERLPRELVASAYAAARVHALPSFAEGAALASLEAAAAARALVVSNRSSEFEYFGDHPFYCDPADPVSIRRAVVRAWEEAGDADRWRSLAAHVSENTWRRTAEATLDAYSRTLAAAPAPARLSVDAPFSALALADEVVADPGLLAAYGGTFGSIDRATLVIYGPDWRDDELVAALAGPLAAAGLDHDDAPDLLALAVPRTEQSEAAIAQGVDAVYSRRAVAEAFRATPRFDDLSVRELRRLAERRWQRERAA
jgi:glycosyltransferase involved in cell wall biosynthesis